MERTKVLVAYASKMGSTAEIGDALAERLAAAGLDVDRRSVGDVGDVDAYQAVVLGSAVYLGRWRSDALGFLKRFGRGLSRRPVWLFQSGPLDDSTDREDVPLPRRVDAVARAIGVRGHVTFGGRIDPEHADGFMARRMVDGGLGRDFRDFDRVRAWADAIATELGACAPAA
jgi:menaquinone-dependent protoporphyrinogen oxidase